MTTLCIQAYNEAEKDNRERDLWVEWHNAYLNRVDKMPTIAELTQPYRAKDRPESEGDAAEVKDGKAELDPVGRDLMNALLANFKPRFEEKKPSEASEAPEPPQEKSPEEPAKEE